MCRERQCMRNCVRYTGFCLHQCKYLWTHSPQGVHMSSCVRCLLFGWVQLVYRRQMLLAWRVILDKSIDRSVICISSIFDGGWIVCVCVCVYTHTHTHTLHVVYSNESPGVRLTHLESPKNPNGLNLRIHISIYVHMYIYMLSGRMRSWTNCFFSFWNILSSEKEKQKMYT